jgi:hypothetical protein
MTSQAQAKTALEGVYGLAFLGFPSVARSLQEQHRDLYVEQMRGALLSRLIKWSRFARNLASAQR